MWLPPAATFTRIQPPTRRGRRPRAALVRSLLRMAERRPPAASSTSARRRRPLRGSRRPRNPITRGEGSDSTQPASGRGTRRTRTRCGERGVSPQLQLPLGAAGRRRRGQALDDRGGAATGRGGAVAPGQSRVAASSAAHHVGGALDELCVAVAGQGGAVAPEEGRAAPSSGVLPVGPVTDESRKAAARHGGGVGTCQQQAGEGELQQGRAARRQGGGTGSAARRCPA